MKVCAGIKKICNNCKSVTRHGEHFIVCVKPKHKQRQG